MNKHILTIAVMMMVVAVAGVLAIQPIQVHAYWFRHHFPCFGVISCFNPGPPTGTGPGGLHIPLPGTAS
jgi:hypothetical protein